MHCWWCCHPIKTKPLHLPNSYDEKKKEYKVYGHFCSWNCVKAYNLDTNDSNTNNRMSLISLMYFDTNCTFKPIRPAPPRQVLTMFGGTMDIDEFRNISKDTLVLANLPPLIYINHNVEYHKRNIKFMEYRQNVKPLPIIKKEEQQSKIIAGENTLLNFLQRI